MIEFKPVVMPSDLKGQSNGKLGPSNLKTVYFKGYGYSSLHPLALRAWNAMVLVCLAATGTVITVSPGGAYRSYESQAQVFNQRMTRNVALAVVPWITRTWDGLRYWLKRGAGFPVATPGTSNHGWGLAVDMALFVNGKMMNITTDAKVWNWIVDNATSFGFSWEGAKPGTKGWEAHHLRYVTGDAVPQRVIDVEKYLGIVP